MSIWNRRSKPPGELPSFDDRPRRAATPPPAPAPTVDLQPPTTEPEEATVKVAVSELRVLREDAEFGRRARRVFERYASIPKVLQRTAEILEKLFRT